MLNMNRKLKIVSLILGLASFQATAQTSEGDTLFITKTDGSLWGFPKRYITQQNTTSQALHITVGDTTYVFHQSEISSTNHTAPVDLPVMTSFKFNNKFNDQILSDVVATIDSNAITADISCIGKYLTPSFQVSTPEAKVYVDNVEQQSQITRHKFDKDIYYTVAHPNAYILKAVLTKESPAIDNNVPYSIEKIALTEKNFSSNLPGKTGEGFEELIDGNVSTFFHSTWDVPQAEKENTIYKTWPHLDIALPTPLNKVKFSYTTRNIGSYWPMELSLQASNDNQTWVTVKKLNSDDLLPTTAGSTFTSDVIALGDNYNHLRLLLDSAAYRRYLVLAEFSLYHVIDNPNNTDTRDTTPDTYQYSMQPYGTDYQVSINWLTNHTTSIPRVDIHVNEGKIITSREEYLRALVTFDGKNVYPSLTDSVNIRGRGNSSWHNPQVYEYNGQQVILFNPKNPYRLKFDSKRKPLGMKNGKNWVLLANKQRGSLMSNAIGMKIAALVGTAAVNHIIPVDVYLNGDYRGNYNLTEHVSISNNSIDLADESECALLELDTYYDETFKFRSTSYDLPVNIKFPEFGDDETNLTQELIESDFNSFMTRLKSGQSIEDIVDIEYLAKYLFVNDLILNYEIIHPKSTYLHRPSYSNGKYIFGPIWDLDWAWGYELSSRYGQTDFMYCTAGAENNFYTSMPFEAVSFIRDLRYASTALDKAYYNVCKNFKENCLQEILDYCDDYYNFAKSSFEQNNIKWGDGKQYATVKENFKSWLTRRLNFIYNNLTHYEEEPPVSTSIRTLETPTSSIVDVYNLQGIKVKTRVPVTEIRQGLNPGIYIVNGKKMIIR